MDDNELYSEYVPLEDQMEEYNRISERNRTELKDVLRNKKVRYLIARILEHCKVFVPLSGVTDSHRLALVAGKRDMGLWLLEKVMEADPKAFIKIQKEYGERENIDE